MATAELCVGRVIQALAEIEGHISAVEKEKKSMEARNPLIGRVGIMMGIGSPPPGFDSRIQAAESKYDELVRRLSNYSQKEGDLKARLSALTGQTFEKSSEWDEWFRKDYQAVPLTEDQKAAIAELLGDLGNERDIEGRINAAEQLGAQKQLGDMDVAAALAVTGKEAAMQFEVKRMTIATMHGVRPDQIDVKPHSDDSQVTSAVVRVLRKMASRKDDTGPKAKAALEDLKASIKSAEIRSRVGL